MIWKCSFVRKPSKVYFPTGEIGGKYRFELYLSVRQLVCHTSFPDFPLLSCFHVGLKVGSKVPCKEVQIKFDLRHGLSTFSRVIVFGSKFRFPDFFFAMLELSSDFQQRKNVLRGTFLLVSE